MKIQQVINDTITLINPTHIKRTLLSLGVDGLCVWSNSIKPMPPEVKRKLDANPSIIYCPFTRNGMNATYKKMNT